MSCAKCQYAYLESDILLCRRWPPQMTAFTRIFPDTVGGGNETDRMQSFFNFPVVNPEWCCGEYARKE